MDHFLLVKVDRNQCEPFNHTNQRRRLRMGWFEMTLNYQVIVERYPCSNGVVGGSISAVKSSLLDREKLARQAGSQEPTHHCKACNKPHPAPRRILRKIGPKGSPPRQVTQCQLFIYLRTERTMVMFQEFLFLFLGTLSEMSNYYVSESTALMFLNRHYLVIEFFK